MSRGLELAIAVGILMKGPELWIGVVFWLGLAAVLLALVPRRAARAWAIGLLVFLAVMHLSAVGMGLERYFSRDARYLDARTYRLELNRDSAGEVQGVWVKNPPVEWSHSPDFPIWYYAEASLVLTFVALVFARRAMSGNPAHEPPATSASGTGRGEPARGP
jgi:hypothetical protein